MWDLELTELYFDTGWVQLSVCKIILENVKKNLFYIFTSKH